MLDRVDYIPGMLHADDAGSDAGAQAPGLRARKQYETKLRIAEVGLRMFSQDSYDATTLEAVAKQASVSPRTLYHYFKTKYDILIFWHGAGFEAGIRPTILQQDRAIGPLGVAKAALAMLVPLYENETLVIADRVWNSTPSLVPQKQLIYLRMEDAVANALGELWPLAECADLMRMAAIVSVGALRHAMAIGRRPGERRSLSERLAETFGHLDELTR